MKGFAQYLANNSQGNFLLQDDSVLQYLEEIFLDALSKKTSDIHFEPYEKHLRVRFRIDGLLHEIVKVDLKLARRFIACLKVMAKLDIGEKRLPQDGRFNLKLSNYGVQDCRISVCPTLFGEKIVIRILNPGNIALCLEELGLESEQQKIFSQHLKRPEGMILVTGPTGSGKTISLYTALNILNSTEKNISTVEDPIEINLFGVNQVEVNLKIGLTFAKVLRAFLRQDPDIIMVGEIRDAETAEIAVKAAQTGHLVLATLHTNNAAEALTRLVNIGVASFNLVSCINLIIAQRLVRKLCPFCKKIRRVSHQVFAQKDFMPNFNEEVSIYAAVGCEKCHRGYKDRVGIFELMSFNNNLAKVFLKGGNILDVVAQAKNEGMRTLRSVALKKVLQGITSLEEINRVVI